MAQTGVTARIGATPYRVELDDGSHHWLADEPLVADGGDSGPNPHQLLLSSLGACTAMTLKMYAARKHWALREVIVRLAFNPDGAPTDHSSLITRHITVHGELSEEQRSRLLQIADACPIHRVLSGTIHIASDLTGA